MRKNAFFKFALVAASLLLVASCSSSPEKAAETTASSSVQSAKLKKHRHNPWQQGYEDDLDITQNTLPNASALKKKSPSLQTNDVWHRIRDGFIIADHETLDAETQRQLRWFIEHPDYVARVVERARPYLFHIVEEIHKRDMPMEIALLPVIESGYKPHAYSKSHASGLWQFIPATGQVFGLEQNWWYDGRRDVIKSTNAALDYLQKLYNDFGDWQLALAAYNCGEGTVGRAIKHNQEQGLATDFWSLNLPAETTAYVPKLMAVSHLVKFPERYDISLSPIDNAPYLGVINVGSQIDLALAAKMADVSEDEMNLLNPAFNRWATAPQGPHELVLPLTQIEIFKSALAKMPANKRVTWARHRVQGGESLSVISRRYNTTVSVIKRANQLSSNQIRAGSHLLIPVSSGQLSNTALAEAEADASRPTAQTRKSTYTVKHGDTWWNIARKHDLDISTLTGWNKKTAHDTLQPGQQLVLWSSQKAARKHVSYTIQNGDSLWAISRKFNVSVAQVREWNGLSDRSMLQPGQSLRLFLDET
jgi:membrane-bound lytic murein transglycosylase D